MQYGNYQSNILPLLTLPTGVIQSQINKMQVIITIYVSQGKVFSFPNDNLFILPKEKTKSHTTELIDHDEKVYRKREMHESKWYK